MRTAGSEGVPALPRKCSFTEICRVPACTAAPLTVSRGSPRSPRKCVCVSVATKYPTMRSFWTIRVRSLRGNDFWVFFFVIAGFFNFFLYV